MIIIVIIVLVLFSDPVYAARTVSLPYSTDFTTDDISDLVWDDCGGTTTYSTSGYSGGAVKITPPTSACSSGNGGMAAIGEFIGFSTSRINIRFLIKFGTSYASGKIGAVNKFIDVKSEGGTRFGILGLQGGGAEYLAPAVCPYPSSWYVYRSPGTNESDHDMANSSFPITDVSKSNVWMSWEYEINTTAGTTTLYITESDGTVTTITSPMETTGSMYRMYIGGYHNGYGDGGANNYYLLDNLVISNTYIGPPTGFVGSATGAVTGITIGPGVTFR